jgi:hypothetical protein
LEIPAERFPARRRARHQVLIGTDDETNFIFGDAGESLIDSARGGNDSLTGGDNFGSGVLGSVFNSLVGDASSMSGSTPGGNDTLTGGDNISGDLLTNSLTGDARSMSDSARGGTTP